MSRRTASSSAEQVQRVALRPSGSQSDSAKLTASAQLKPCRSTASPLQTAVLCFCRHRPLPSFVEPKFAVWLCSVAVHLDTAWHGAAPSAAVKSPSGAPVAEDQGPGCAAQCGCHEFQKP